MNLSQISKWLRKTPQPAVVVVDGVKRIDVGTRGGKWAEVARSIEALGATKLEALDGQGHLLRAVTMDDDDDEPEAKRSRAPEHASCPTCGVSLDRFAALLSDAYEKGSNAQKSAYLSIFEENTKLVRLLADRLGALEVAWQKSLQSHARLITEVAEANAAAIAEQGNGQDESILATLATGFMQGQANGAVPKRSK